MNEFGIIITNVCSCTAIPGPRSTDIQGSPPAIVAGMPVGSGVSPQPAFMYRGVWIPLVLVIPQGQTRPTL